MSLSHIASFILSTWILFSRAKAHKEITECSCGLPKAPLENGTIPGLFSWKLYIHAISGDLSPPKTCLGTLIASNILLASKKCMMGMGTSTQPNYNPMTLGSTEVIVTENANRDEGHSYPVVGLLPWNGDGSNWMVAVQVDFDFTTTASIPKPVCLPTQDELQSLNVSAGQTIMYESMKSGSIHNLTVKKGHECDISGTKNQHDIHCLILPSDNSHNVGMEEVGQPIFSEIPKNPHARYPHGYYTYLVGISTSVREGNEGTKQIIFVPVNSLSKSIQAVRLNNTQWCNQPWPWLTNDNVKRDESLDCECGIPRESAQGRIIGGEEAIPYEFPWLVKFDRGNNSPPCGGSLISDRVILTAAHCLVDRGQVQLSGRVYDNIQDYEPKIMYQAFLHSHKRYNDSKEIEVWKQFDIIHPGYADSVRSRNRLEYDIALVILERPLNLSAVGPEGGPLYRPLCLTKPGERFDVAGIDAVVAGWGASGLHTLPTELQKLYFKFHPLHACTDPFKPDIFNTVLCGGLTAFTNSPNLGDSGGPAFLKRNADHEKYTQVGVVGYGARRKNPDVAAIFFQDLQELIPFVDYHSNLHGAKYCRK